MTKKARMSNKHTADENGESVCLSSEIISLLSSSASSSTSVINISCLLFSSRLISSIIHLEILSRIANPKWISASHKSKQLICSLSSGIIYPPSLHISHAYDVPYAYSISTTKVPRKT
ncbi:hypothetical protein WUBG_07775 [Wuchereria bancrofti]|uniref:Uncharacterized protein n=1 Tax=Wuchereria bancrofti TaxID=6293 RepID=J9EVZ2_WUCBA|nr:hypothetical protein WUBG_07775 [Wuchereria bancrofti]